LLAAKSPLLGIVDMTLRELIDALYDAHANWDAEVRILSGRYPADIECIYDAVEKDVETCYLIAGVADTHAPKCISFLKRAYDDPQTPKYSPDVDQIYEGTPE